jgi:hypothetical protein
MSDAPTVIYYRTYTSHDRTTVGMSWIPNGTGARPVKSLAWPLDTDRDTVQTALAAMVASVQELSPEDIGTEVDLQSEQSGVLPVCWEQHTTGTIRVWWANYYGEGSERIVPVLAGEQPGETAARTAATLAQLQVGGLKPGWYSLVGGRMAQLADAHVKGQQA